MDVAEAPAEPDAGPLAGLLVADFSRVLAGPYATMLLARPGRRRRQGGEPRRRRHPHVDAAGPRRGLDVLPRRQPQQAVDRPRPQGRGGRRPGPRARPPGRRRDRELQARRPGSRSGSATTTSRRATRASSTPRSAGSAPAVARSLPGYDLIVQAISGLMSLTGDPDGSPYRAGISVFDVMTGLHATIGILAALHAPGGDRARPARRGQPAVVRAARAGQPPSAVVAGGVVPFRMGNAHPSLFPYEPLPTADGELIVTAGNDGQFRTLCQVLGVPELADDPRFARQPGPDGEPRRAAAAARRAAARRARRTSGSTSSSPPACPAGRSTRSTGASRSPSGSGLDPVVAVGPEAPSPSVRHPITFSATPARYALPPPGLDEHGDAIRAWLAPACRRPPNRAPA